MMRTYLLLALFALVVCWTEARRGSITDDLFEDDVNDDEIAASDDDSGSLDAERRRHPCFKKKCRRGETCIIGKNDDAKCVCTKDCSFYERAGDRFQVCSNKNVTYKTECHLDRDHCLCKKKDSDCSSPGARKIQLEYYGPCQDMQPCSDDHLQQFPHRMRDWLFVVMEEMARRTQLGEYLDLLEEAGKDENHSYAVIWKFCDLDKDPHDRVVSRRELQYTVRSLRAMEHCLLPFLDECDEDDNRQITLLEWGKCLQLEHSKISDKCREIHQR